ncbi:MAG: DUF4326 domain-containing protein [Deltaproteobacteria bacterium]|nr:DUF4326 domain-containing protein [Deltaproteobacteria bacterium]
MKTRGVCINRPPGPFVPVHRGTVFGNPFFYVPPGARRPRSKKALVQVESPEMAVSFYRDWLEGRSYEWVDPDRRQKILERIPGLKGKNLACFCPEGAPCHRDVLVDLAEEAK